MSTQDQLKKGAEQGAARETMRKGEARMQQAAEAAEEGFQIAGDSAREMSLKLIEIVRTNAEALCNFAEEVVSARDPVKLAEIWAKHTQKQMELLAKHGQELASLGRSMASTGVNAVSDRMR
jgi:hypothetical protein